MPFVYALVCARNGFVYVGTTFDLTKRMCQHRYQLNRRTHTCQALVADWQRYGSSAFRMVVLEILPDKRSFDFSTAQRRWQRLFASQRRLYSKGRNGLEPLEADDVQRCLAALEEVKRHGNKQPSCGKRNASGRDDAG
jgi:group I intron endonuclease